MKTRDTRAQAQIWVFHPAAGIRWFRHLAATARFFPVHIAVEGPARPRAKRRTNIIIKSDDKAV